MRIANIIALLAPFALGAAAEPSQQRAPCATGIPASYKSRVTKALSSSGVIPTLIPQINPLVRIDATYGSKRVNLGTVLTPIDTSKKPKIRFTAERGQQNATYSIFLMDPDVPSPEDPPVIRTTFLHWYIAHAKPCVERGGNGSEIVAFYVLPTPLSVKHHTYTFLVYREPAGYEPKRIRPQIRPGFDINKYTREGGLKLIGANYYSEGLVPL